MTIRVGVDMDGTIADFTTLAFIRANELYGLNLKSEEVSKPKIAQIVWEKMSEEQRSKYTDYRELHAEICPKGFFLEIEPLPGAIDAVKRLAKDKEIEIVFVTKPLNWDRSAAEKITWLEKYFSDISYEVIMVDSIKTKRFIDVDFIIDDDVRVMENIEGNIPILIKQPHNIETRNRYPFVVDNVSQAVDIIIEQKKNLYSWWKKNNEAKIN